jgi:hypothetical protein
LVAFSRSYKDQHIVVIARVANNNARTDGDLDTSVKLPAAGEWTNVLQSGLADLDQTTDISSLLGTFCVAVYASPQ